MRQIYQQQRVPQIHAGYLAALSKAGGVKGQPGRRVGSHTVTAHLRMADRDRPTLSDLLLEELHNTALSLKDRAEPRHQIGLVDGSGSLERQQFGYPLRRPTEVCRLG